ncbi:hypothetical protein D3C80_1755110 [compost metagenome]
MPRRQRLHTADARDDLHAQRHALFADQVEYAQCAVVQGGLAPQQEGTCFTVANFLLEQARIQRSTLPVPVLHRAQVVIRLRITQRVDHRHQAIATFGAVALQNGLAQTHQFIFVVALVEHEEHAGTA